MILRRLLAAMLTLTLLLTSGAMAVSRGQMATGVMLHVVCIDGAAKLVAIGPDGAPVEQQAPCPDCVMGALLATTSAVVGPGFSLAARAADPLQPPAVLLSRSVAQAAPARGPPLSV
jgi:hypothetical protein